MRDRYRIPIVARVRRTAGRGTRDHRPGGGERPIAESRLGCRVISWGMCALHDVGLRTDKLSGASAERALSADEIGYLRTIYGDSIDYDAIRIRQGGVKDFIGMRSNAVAHDIFMADNLSDENPRDANGNPTPSGRAWLATLGHEAMHVRQYEQRGTGYIGDALMAQWFGDGYDLEKAFDEARAFEDMNPEQQGVLAQNIGLAILDDPGGQLTQQGFEAASGITLTAARWQVVVDAHTALLAG